MSSNPEELINKNIFDVDSKVSLSISDINSNIKIYRLEKDLYFLNTHYKSAVISTDIDDTINSISLNQRKIIDLSMYNKMVDKYGKPSSLLKIGEIIESDEQVTGESGIKIKSSKYSAVKCLSIEESPTTIIWNCKNYKIEVTINRESINTNINFSKL